MQLLTQTKPNNCWQTCVAILLDCPVEKLPDQSCIEDQRDRGQYAKLLEGFLLDNYSVCYREFNLGLRPLLKRQQVIHIMIGETVRTSSENESCHAIIGVGGEPHWDVHPSRAGLTKVLAFGVLVPVEGARDQ